MDRRELLKSLGISALGIAFAENVPWIFKETVIAYDGPITTSWVAAEALAVIKERLAQNRFTVAKCLDHTLTVPRVGGGVTQLGLDIAPASSADLTMVRERIIVPAAILFADKLTLTKPKRFLHLPLPHDAGEAHFVIDDDDHLGLRVIKTYDILNGWAFRFESLVEV